MTLDVLVIAPFRRPTFRKAISEHYPVQEPWDSPPLIVAGGLEAAGLTVEYLALQNILDSWDEPRDLPKLREMLADMPARMVIFATDYFIPSRSTATLFGMRIAARELRADDSRVIIGAVGRLATTAAPQLFDQLPECDFLVHGEPESVIGTIAEEILRRGVTAVDHPSLLTPTSLQSGQRPQPATTQMLDETPIPAWHLLAKSLDWWDKYRGQDASQPIPFSLRTSAGCRFRCRFCAGVPNWLNYRTKTATRVATEIDTLRNATGDRAHLAFLEDEIFTRHPDHVHAISEVCVQRGIVFDGVYTHSSLLTPEVAEPLSKMAQRVYLGLDNPDDSILHDMRKGQRFDTVLRAIETARASGLSAHLEWIIGSPADTIDSLITSLNAIVTLLSTGVVDSINTYVYCPHPGTEYAEKADEFGMRVIDGFEDIQESGGYPAHDTHALSRQQTFIAYLMSQLTIAEVSRDRERGLLTPSIGSPSRHELHRLFDKVAGR
ncbi:B12-binding domain-containing radical SAM protein [Gandjariella thermophila]|uniref:Radical SAM protein n=1 Tax=Gandjariella thermophila TaxID=1931992 RepID=A0A4D4JG38_9PSEU|nr:radical SAM protein [Gandjariella thermophila]GDY33980.1 radical SAM protein [Gandjariella thermophila]